MQKFLVLIVLICLVQGSFAEEQYFEDFEFSDDIYNHGFDVENNNNNDIKVYTHKNAAVASEYGLFVDFIGNDGSVFIHTPLFELTS